MLVLREPVRQYCTAPSARKLLDALKQLGAHCHEAFEDASNAVRLILEDLKDAVLTMHQNALLDAINLLDLVYYLLYWPLKAVYQYFQSQHDRNPFLLSKLATTYTTSWENLFLLFTEVKTKLETSHILSFRKGPVSPFENRKEVMEKKIEGIPALGIVELLLRAIAEKSTLTSIAEIHETFRELKLARLDYSRAKTGIPSVINICTYKKPNEEVFYAVITTNADKWDFMKKEFNKASAGEEVASTNPENQQWDTYTSLSAFFRTARNERRMADPFKSHSKDIFYIENQTRSLQYLYKNYATKSELFDNTPAYDHGNVILRPLTSPTFEYKSRCLRCQFLFLFNIEDKFKRFEIGNRTNGDGRVNASMNCAETYAHFYCKYGFGSGELESPHNDRNGWLRAHPLR